MSEQLTVQQADLMRALYASAPRCFFHVRTQVTTDPPTYHYNRRTVLGEGHGQPFTRVTPHPPAVGDLVHLDDEGVNPQGVFRVVERAWTYPQCGSTDWPFNQQWPLRGPILNVIVVAETHIFRDEAPDPEAVLQEGRERGDR
ncbi:hypothetical protein [Streptomyces sp. NPDC051561]|uniref:hypothetical protein n=1 Tax=Streptomyces sp. NPDC051561 TaxID=3365658 RepID=UPI0037A9BD93